MTTQHMIRLGDITINLANMAHAEYLPGKAANGAPDPDGSSLALTFLGPSGDEMYPDMVVLRGKEANTLQWWLTTMATDIAALHASYLQFGPGAEKGKSNATPAVEG